jgi:hypothetical protein
MLRRSLLKTAPGDARDSAGDIIQWLEGGQSPSSLPSATLADWLAALAQCGLFERILQAAAQPLADVCCSHAAEPCLFFDSPSV